jgi:hypothetical protein
MKDEWASLPHLAPYGGVGADCSLLVHRRSRVAFCAGLEKDKN